MKKRSGNAVYAAYEAVREGALEAYRTSERIAVGGYKAVENAVTGTYRKIEDRFIDRFLREDGETVEEAKKRIIKQLNSEQKEK